MMLFGEKYPDIVRMVSMGDFSRELCGGTHLDNTAQVGMFKVVGEESVSAGTRRITALTGSQAVAHLRRAEAALAETAALLRVPPAEVPSRVAALVKELRELKKHTSSKGAGDVSAEKLLAEATDLGGVRVVVAEVPGTDAGMMRQLIDQLRKQASPIAVLLGSREAEKVTLVAGISRDLEARGLDAGQWIRGAAEAVGGRGGGKADMAQAGGKHPEKLPEALEIARATVSSLLAS
jgi:alanyl-tRNA synthetase